MEAKIETASSLLHGRGFSARTSARVTFSRDTLEQKVAASSSKPAPVPRSDIRPVFGEGGKISEKDSSSGQDPALVNLVTYHSKLVSASGRSFDLVVGKLCHLLKTNGHVLDTKYQDTMDALFFSIRSLIVDQEKSDLSRTRLLEVLELRARYWDQDRIELSEVTTTEPAQPILSKDAVQERASPQDQHVPHPRYSPNLRQQDVTPLFSQEELNMAMSTPFPDDSDEENQWVTISDATYESDTSDEFAMPEMEELMLESTSELDDELARLLASKIPDSYKRQVNDGKPVRYTVSFLLNCWRSPFAKEMPPVLRHTISHSDVSFIIHRHAFTDPKELFTPESRKGIHLLKSHLTLGSESGHTPNSGGQLGRRRPGTPQQSTWAQGASSGAQGRERTKSWPQPGGGGGRSRNWENVRQGGPPGVSMETGGGDIGEGGNVGASGSSRTRHLSGASTPESTPVSTGGGDGGARRRTRHVSGGLKQMNEGSLRVTFSLPDENKEETKTAPTTNPWKTVSSMTNVLSLGEITKQEDTDVDTGTVESLNQTDINNNGNKKDDDVPESENSPSPLRKPGIPTFKEVFKEVIEQGLTAASKDQDRRTPSPMDGYSLRPNYGVPASSSAPHPNAGPGPNTGPMPFPSPNAGTVPFPTGPVPMQMSSAPHQYRGGWRPGQDWQNPGAGVCGPVPPPRGLLGPYPGYPGPPQSGLAYPPMGGLPYGMGGKLTVSDEPSVSAYVCQAK